VEFGRIVNTCGSRSRLFLGGLLPVSSVIVGGITEENRRRWPVRVDPTIVYRGQARAVSTHLQTIEES
jgi:hypothetical protein